MAGWAASATLQRAMALEAPHTNMHLPCARPRQHYTPLPHTTMEGQWQAPASGLSGILHKAASAWVCKFGHHCMAWRSQQTHCWPVQPALPACCPSTTCLPPLAPGQARPPGVSVLTPHPLVACLWPRSTACHHWQPPCPIPITAKPLPCPPLPCYWPQLSSQPTPLLLAAVPISPVLPHSPSPSKCSGQGEGMAYRFSPPCHGNASSHPHGM